MIGRAVTARACANIALVKYWGKRDARLNLPAAGSVSLTLGALTTTTTVRFTDELELDRLALDGGEPSVADERLAGWLDLVRARADFDLHADIVSANDFPTASGLASSASAYAALAVAATAAAGLELPPRELSILARRGSGSAARSIFGGFAVMHAGEAPDGSDAYAEPLDGADAWPVRMVIAIVGGGVKKKHGSRDAMQHCADTSPLYRGWIGCVPGDIDRARAAIAARDLAALGETAEASALAMHAAALASRPAIVYWQPPTLAAMQAVRDLRDAGTPAYYTMDAGPHVKVLTTAEHAERVATSLAAIDGVTDTIITAAGGPAQLTT